MDVFVLTYSYRLRRSSISANFMSNTLKLGVIRTKITAISLDNNNNADITIDTTRGRTMLSTTLHEEKLHRNNNNVSVSKMTCYVASLMGRGTRDIHYVAAG